MSNEALDLLQEKLIDGCLKSPVSGVKTVEVLMKTLVNCATAYIVSTAEGSTNTPQERAEQLAMEVADMLQQALEINCAVNNIPFAKESEVNKALREELLSDLN